MRTVHPRWKTTAIALALAALGCGRARLTSATVPSPAVAISSATLDDTRHVVVTYTLSQGGQGSGDATAALAPAWTLAGLSVDPVTVGLAADPADSTGQFVRPPVPAWRSYLLSGAVLKALPIDGPGTPGAFVLANTRQPGSETSGAVKSLGGGRYSYTFQNPLPPDYDPTQTLRVGIWLQGTSGTAQTSATFDFVPAGGAPQQRELVLDASCARCHGLLRAHGGYRAGVKLCATCHTYQNADPDTVDPAALAGATPDANPNPLDLGRLVHRIHRGRELPTLYVANPTQPSPPKGTPPTSSRANVALPFFPGRNAPLPGQKYSVVGYQGQETVFGQVVTRVDNAQPATAVATGVRFPQDLRNCEACHGGAAQAAEHFNDISRRTCQGCHADVWFGDPSLITDQVHYMHAGDVQPDDSACYGCHVPTSAFASVDADITAIHVPPATSPSWNGLTVQIAGVQDMLPGQRPTVLLAVLDRDGPVSPLGAPTPATDASSPVPRALGRVAITIAGPTSPDYVSGNFAAAGAAPITETVPLTATADASGQLSYTFGAALPGGATGTWAVGVEARRQFTTTGTAFYDPTADAFSWPFTGETLTEYADNPVQYVDVSVGTAGSGAPSPRRQIVSRDGCNACHRTLSAHGDLRHNVDYCVMCHAPDATDWVMRPKDASGNVALGQTFDGIEERSIHFKVMIHRVHTGGRTGSAELDVTRPFVIYGYGGPGKPGIPHFFDDVRFPGELASCTLCHVNGSYAGEAVPASALPTVANETPSVQHQATAAHASTEEITPPVQAACLGCHDTPAAHLHAQRMDATAGGDRCIDCHGLTLTDPGLNAAHGLPNP